MVTALLCTLSLLGPQAQASQAHLHPANTDLYFEVPDLPTLIAAYDSAPIVQLTRDEEIRASITALMTSLEGELSQGIATAAEQLGQDSDELLAIPEMTLEWLHGVESLSASGAGFIEGITLHGEQKVAWDEAFTESAELQQKLDVWLSDGGQVPEELTILEGVSEALATDAWGHRYVVLGEQNRVQSLGPTGALEGSDLARRWAAGAGRFELRDMLKRAILERCSATLVMRFTSPEACQDLAERTLVLAANAGVDFENSSFELGGEQVDLRQATLEGTGLGPEVSKAWLASGEKVLVLGLGASTPEAFSERMSRTAASLADDTDYKGAASGLRERSGNAEGVLGVRWFERDSLARIFLMAAGVDEPEAAQMAEMFGTQTVSIAENRLVGNRFHQDRWSPKSGPGFFDDVLGVKPADTARVQLVPDDAIAVQAASVDWKALYAKVKGLIAEQGPDQALERFEAALAQLEEAYGVDLEGELLGSLGSSVVFYMQPITIGVPNCGLLLELEDPEAFQNSMEALGGLFAEQTGGAFEMTSRAYKRIPVWTVKRTQEPFPSNWNLGEAGPQIDQLFSSPFAPTPSFVVVDDTAVLGLTSMHAKRMVKRGLDDDRDLHPLLDMQVPAGAQSIGFMDWAGMWMNFYSMGRSALGMAGGSLPFNAADLPAPEDIEQYFSPTVSWTRSTEEGVWSHKSSSFGPEVIGVPMIAMGFFGTLAAPAVVQRQGQATQAVGRARGNMISAALDAYAIQNDGSYPASLDELESSGHWAEWGNGQSMLDEWDRPFRYEVDGMNIRLWSMGPNGFDEDGHGDDLVIRGNQVRR